MDILFSLLQVHFTMRLIIKNSRRRRFQAVQKGPERLLVKDIVPRIEAEPPVGSPSSEDFLSRLPGLILFLDLHVVQGKFQAQRHNLVPAASGEGRHAVDVLQKVRSHAHGYDGAFAAVALGVYSQNWFIHIVRSR